MDENSQLMWKVKDNGSQISGKQAILYCDGLVLAGFDNWRQPSIEELQGVYDSTMHTMPKIKLPIELSSGGFWVWSGTKGSGYNFPSTRILSFYDGSREQSHLDDVHVVVRALCVRRSGG